MTYKEALNKYVLAWYEVMLAVKEEGVSEEQFESDAYQQLVEYLITGGKK